MHHAPIFLFICYKRKNAVNNKASELCNEYLKIYLNQYMALPDAKERKLGDKYDPKNLFLVDDYNYDNWLENEESTETTRKSDKEESDMPPLEGDEEESDMPPLKGDEGEVREGKRVKILIPNKLLTILQILLTQIKAGKTPYRSERKKKKII